MENKTRKLDWARYRAMTTAERSEVNTGTTFAENREQEKTIHDEVEIHEDSSDKE